MRKMMSRWHQVIRSVWKPLVGTLALLLMILGTSGVLRHRISPGTLAYESGQALPQGVETVVVRAEPFGRRLAFPGSVTSEHHVDVRARLQAHVLEALAGAGDAVVREAPLLRLDDRDLQEHRGATEARLRQAETEYGRTRRLFESQATTQQALTAAESAFAAARADAERARVMLSHSIVHAPMDGLVVDRYVEVGDLAVPGQTLMRMYDPGAMRFDVPVPMRFIDRVPLQSEQIIVLESVFGTLTGTVVQVVGEVDPVSRTRLVKLALPGPPPAILPGTFGRLRIESEPRAGIRIPETAVFRVGQLEKVKTVRGDRVYRSLVATGSVADGLVEILSGLADGDRIVVNPLKEL